jgi:hypothetical protein
MQAWWSQLEIQSYMGLKIVQRIYLGQLCSKCDGSGLKLGSLTPKLGRHELVKIELMNFPGVFYSGQIQNEYVPVTG